VYDFAEQLPEMVAAGLGKPVRTLSELRRTDVRAQESAVGLIDAYASNLNVMLEREGAPYRYRNLQLVAITSQEELDDEVCQAALISSDCNERVWPDACRRSMSNAATTSYGITSFGSAERRAPTLSEHMEIAQEMILQGSRGLLFR